MERKPQSANTFAELWKCPEDAIINGNETIPNILRRQNRLIGKTLDACIVLHVYEQIKEGHDFDSLLAFFPKKFSESSFEKLQKASDEEKLKQLVEMVQRPEEDQNLKSHYNLIKDKVWNDYSAKLKSYHYKTTLLAEELNESVRSHTGKPLPEIPDMPEDPRIKVINDKIRPTIHIYNSGAKEPKSIDDKKKRKGGAKLSELRDINRITVLPTKPEYARDFITILKLLNPTKDVDKNQIPRLFAEEPELRDNGYYNQKINVALDNTHEHGVRTRDNTGTIAEIKILPAKMLVADKLSAPINTIERMINHFTKDFIIDAEIIKQPSTEEFNIFKDALKDLFDYKQKEFEKLNEKLGTNYHFPKFPAKNNLNEPEAYIELGKELNNLATWIHVDAIIHENRAWQEQYLITALKQQLGQIPEIKQGINSKTETNMTRTEIIPNAWLNRIAEKGNLNLASLEKQVLAELNLRKPRKPTNQVSLS